MQPKIKLAKIELHLFTLLEESNSEFSILWESSQNSKKKQRSFQNCAQKYEKIMELIDHNRERNNISDLLESYYLEAWLGKIQSHLNDLPQDPSNEDVVLKNNKKIEKLKHSLIDLKSHADNLQTKLITKKIPSALSKDYHELFKKINAYFSSWDEIISKRKAVYYYNCAEALIEETTSKNSDYDLKINLFESAIGCLDFSGLLYQKVRRVKDAKETLDRKNEIEKQLKQLKKSQEHTLKRKKISARPEKSATNSSKAFESSHPDAPKNPTEPSNNDTLAVASAVPPKKRKNWIIPDEEEPANKKSHISPTQINVTTDILLKSEEEMVQQKEDQFKKMLTQIPANDSFRFYGGLFFSLSQKLQICSKESSNHTLLTTLSWLTLAKELIGLTANKNAADNTDIQKIATKITSLSTANQKNLKTISSQKRAEAYPTYTDLQDRDLQNLFIEEVTDYYYGLEAFNLKSVAMNFLDSIPNLIKEKSFARLIEDTINNVGKPTENLFYANLLRELVKFHICDENEHWRNNTFSPEKKDQLNNEYLRILTISEGFAEGLSSENQALQNKIKMLVNHIQKKCNTEQKSKVVAPKFPSTAFFRNPQQSKPLSIELLNTTLQEHIQCLIKCRAPSIHSEVIYNDLLQFIQTHCKNEQASSSYSRICQP